MSNSIYCKALWLGGGVRWETMAAIEVALRNEADRHGADDPVKMELLNAANAAAAELTQRHYVPKWEDLL